MLFTHKNLHITKKPRLPKQNQQRFLKIIEIVRKILVLLCRKLKNVLICSQKNTIEIILKKSSKQTLVFWMLFGENFYQHF